MRLLWYSSGEPRHCSRIKLTHEGSYEGTPPAVRLPIDIKPRSSIGIGESDRWHGVGQWRERRIKGYLVATEVILIIDRTGLHRGELSSTQQRYSVMLWIHH